MRRFTCGKAQVSVYPSRAALGLQAAKKAAEIIQAAVAKRGKARIIVATGNSQLDFISALVEQKEIAWPRVEMFHMDEYIGLPITHPGSFRRMLLEQLINKTGIIHYHLLDGDGDVPFVVRNLSETISSAPIDIIFLGIGENAHLAFNDPPADFETEEPYLVVNLDEACRRQQVGEAWFTDISQVPKQAISMSVRQILKARELLAVAPDSRKAEAVRACVEGEISPTAPASILRTHPNATVYLDTNSAALLSAPVQSAI